MKKGLVLVTYRDREVHLSCLIHQLSTYWPELTIAVIEQEDTAVFNKGLLYNVGYKLLATDYDYIVLHDVDWIGTPGKVDYSYCSVPTMIGGEASQFDYKLFYRSFFGGVVVCSKEHYELVNGFSNLFRGWGGEDDLLYASFLQKGIQPQVKNGRFECFHHPRPDVRGSYKNHPDYIHNLQLCTAPRDYSEGLSTIPTGMTYKVDTLKTHIHYKIKTAQ